MEVLLGVLEAGGVAVPLAVSHPPAELEYVIKDTAASVVVAGPGFESVLAPLAKAAHARFVLTADVTIAASTAAADLAPQPVSPG